MRILLAKPPLSFHVVHDTTATSVTAPMPLTSLVTVPKPNTVSIVDVMAIIHAIVAIPTPSVFTIRSVASHSPIVMLGRSALGFTEKKMFGRTRIMTGWTLMLMVVSAEGTRKYLPKGEVMS